MPLSGSLRSTLPAIPALDNSSYPPSLKQKSSDRSVDFSYSQFRFDKENDKIGEGGNAAVYRATVRNRDLTVALKRPFPGKTVKKETVEQILSEAKKWERVDDHPYIATILDWGSEALPWIAIEYLDGGPITSHIEECSVAQRLWTAYAIVDAVAYASGQRGVTHHDLKPQNILLQQTSVGTWNVPKVVDWGLSRELIQHTGSISQATPEYAAPEQFNALMPDTTVGAHTDVYQLGIVCYELLTGEHPDHLHGTPSPPSETATEIPTMVDSVIMDALAHKRTARIEHPLLLRDALEDVLKQIFQNPSETEHTQQQNSKTLADRTQRESPEKPSSGSPEHTGEPTAQTNAGGISERAINRETQTQPIGSTSEDTSPDAETGWFTSDRHPEALGRQLSTAIRSARTQPTDDSIAEAIDRHRFDSIAVAIDSLDKSSNQ